MTFIHDISPELVNFGSVAIRWYGVLFAAGLALNYLLVRWIFKKQKYSLEHLDSITIYLVFGLIIGARLGHVLFYNPGYFLANPLEILMIWKGGLASHGAAIGVLFAYCIWLKVYKVKFLKYADVAILGFPITSAFVRIGNFFNSEIVGTPVGGETGAGNWGVVFKRLGETFPRHPVQLYEAGACLIVFIILFLIYRKYYKKTPPLFFLFLYMGLYFLGRFFVEEWKDLHALPESFPLSMGQVLSIPFLLAAVVYFAGFFPRLKRRRG